MRVVIGRIGRAHGIRGDVAVELRTDEPERRFAPGSSVLSSGRELVVASSRPHSGRFLVRFVGVADRTAAEALRGQLVEVEVDEDEIPDDDGEFYDRQLVGLAVVTADERVGEVTEVLHLPAHDLLVVATDAGDVMVPFVEALVPDVDLEAGTLTVADVPGLLRPDEAEEVR